MKNIKNIVISGGNTSVFAFFGFFKYLSENNLLNNVEAYTGTSAGAVTGLLFSIGYKWNEMYQFNRIFNYSKLYDFSLTSFINKCSNSYPAKLISLFSCKVYVNKLPIV